MTQLQLPESFLKTMQKLLGEEYESFLEGFDEKRQFGLRVNTSKMESEEFARIAPFHLSKIPWIADGYFYKEEDAPAKHPFYAAGLYYLQEPSAMTPASRLPVTPGERVLDLCAAPGGKATALGAKLRGEGLLVANDINTARAKALLRNLELFGISNAFVTNEPPYILAEKYPEYFDKIMVDAPCSGEGMFRKNPAVVEAWQEKGPEYFSKLQKEIILHGADMLRPGGMMLYSTCTFSPAENEAVITHLLRERPEMEVIPMENYEGFSEGITEFDGEVFDESCRLCRRIFPHKMPGEGHFMALLHKKGGVPTATGENHSTGEDVPTDESHSGGEGALLNEGVLTGARAPMNRTGGNVRGGQTRRTQRWWEVCAGLNKEQRQALEDFFVHVHLDLSPERIDVRGDRIYYVPEEIQPEESRGSAARENAMRRNAVEGRTGVRKKGKKKPANPKGKTAGIHFLRNGLYLGDLKKKRFEPAQPFALALSKETFDNCLNFSGEDPRLTRYLRGESISLEESAPAGCKSAQQEPPSKTPLANGWYLILAEGYPLGFAKLAGHILKNKYPAGWRRN